MKYIIYHKTFNKDIELITLSKINFNFKNKKQVFNFLRLARILENKFFVDFEIFNKSKRKKIYDIYHFLNLDKKTVYKRFTKGF